MNTATKAQAAPMASSAKPPEKLEVIARNRGGILPRDAYGPAWRGQRRTPEGTRISSGTRERWSGGS